MTFLTIVSAPKPFTDPHIATIQRNAIQSWLHLGQEVEVLLIGEEAGMAEAARELGVRQISEVARNAQGTPLVSSIFDLARRASSSPLLAYVNADILIMPDLVEAARRISSLADRFLIVGQRWNLDVQEALDFNPGWVERLKADLDRRGWLHPPRGSDYFIFPRQCFTNIPDFAIGRAGWDNWMIYHAIQSGMLTLDATPSVSVIHQNHDYRHLAGGRPHYDLEESETNRRLAGGKASLYILLDTQMQLVDGQVRRSPLTLERLIRRFELRLYPQAGDLHGVRRFLARRLRRLRKRLRASASKEGYRQ